jgi:hypothetical protein
MRDVLHSCAPLPLIPPTPFSHKGRRGILGVLMPETGDGTQGLTKKSTPVRICPRYVRLRRAYQQRLPWVRAPPARISAAPALGARASGAHGSSEDWRFRTVSQAPKG